jgi:hypothetical protein
MEISIRPEWETPRSSQLAEIRSRYRSTDRDLVFEIVNLLDRCGTIEAVRQARHWLMRLMVERDLSEIL